MDPLTQEQFKKALPEKFHKGLNKELMTQINSTLAEPELFEQFRDNLISYTGVLMDGKFRIDAYINAVKYCSFKLMGKSNQEAYTLTFPDRAKKWAANAISSKDIASYVSIYNKSKLVNLIMEQTLIPSWILNQDIYQKAINTQAAMMVDPDVSPKVRSDAANSILTHLKRPETHKVELNVNKKDDKSISELREATMQLARRQREMIESGQMNATEAAHQRIIEGESERIE